MIFTICVVLLRDFQNIIYPMKVVRASCSLVVDSEHLARLLLIVSILLACCRLRARCSHYSW
ncbi:MAG: hypothetical protein KME64_28630 [Scytonematopsis contorta HA4267-MV1]|nr:hypothetical protein [Scytonematopsis contorta HA4267-MV1]